MFQNELEKIKALLKERKLEHLWNESITNHSYKKVLDILNMPEWKEKRYQGLLTSSIWNSNYEEIKKILAMPEWQEEKYQSLLTSSIWNSAYEKIKDILAMPEWQEEKYQHLLSPTILTLTVKHIRDSIKQCDDLGIISFVTISVIRKKDIEIKALYEYLEEREIPIILNEKLHPIFNMASINLKRKYNIDLKELVKKQKLKEGMKK